MIVILKNISIRTVFAIMVLFFAIYIWKKGHYNVNIRKLTRKHMQMFFYKEAGMLKIVMAYVITTITVTLGANSVFQVLLYMKGNASFIVKYLGLLPGRIIQSLIMLCFQIALTEYCLNGVHILYRINRARVTGKHRQ